METTFWPRVRAQRALCAAEILARAAALIVRRPRLVPVLLNPDSALIAVSRAFTCCAALSRSAFNSAIMSMCSPRARIVADAASYAALCINVNSTRNASSSSLRSSAVFMNCLTCGLDTFRKFGEIVFQKSSVVQVLPRGMGHSGLPAGVQGSVEQIPGILRLGSSHSSTFSTCPSLNGVREIAVALFMN